MLIGPYMTVTELGVFRRCVYFFAVRSVESEEEFVDESVSSVFIDWQLVGQSFDVVDSAASTFAAGGDDDDGGGGGDGAEGREPTTPMLVSRFSQCVQARTKQEND